MISIANAVGMDYSLIKDEVEQGYDIFKDLTKKRDWIGAATSTINLASELWYQDVLNIATVQSSECLIVTVSHFVPSNIISSS